MIRPRATLAGAAAYVPAGRLGHVVIGGLGLNALLAWLEIVGIYTFLERVWRGLAGRFVGPETLDAHWAEVEMLRRLHGGIWIATALVFLVWLHRAYRNLPALGIAEPRFTPGAAVSAFVVPVLNVVMPVRVVRDLWNGSDPSRARERDGPGRTAPWVAWWWGVFVASALLDPVVLRLAGNLHARLTIGTTVLLVLAQLLEMAAAILAMGVVWFVGQGQQEIAGRDSDAV